MANREKIKKIQRKMCASDVTAEEVTIERGTGTMFDPPMNVAL